MYSVDQPVSSACGAVPLLAEFLDDLTQVVHIGESAQYVIKIASRAANRVAVAVAVDQTKFSTAITLRPQRIHRLLQEEPPGRGVTNSKSSSPTDAAAVIADVG